MALSVASTYRHHEKGPNAALDDLAIDGAPDVEVLPSLIESLDTGGWPERGGDVRSSISRQTPVAPGVRRIAAALVIAGRAPELPDRAPGRAGFPSVSRVERESLVTPGELR
ncbi:MAG: hypothetical protein ACRD3M_01875, partial [Thermoanaerobaculia bacterium]